MSQANQHTTRSTKVVKAEVHYDRWQEVKAHQREEEHKLLKQKLILQRKLIATVDTRSHQREQELVKKDAKEREAVRLERKQRETALIEKGKESIARGNLRKTTGRKCSSVFTEDCPSVRNQKYVNRRRPDCGGRLSIIHSREGERSAMMSAGCEHTVDQSAIVGVSSEGIEVERWSLLPSHNNQIGSSLTGTTILGRQAQSTIPGTTRENEMTVAMRRLGGRAGANTLWMLLRDTSNSKLEEVDSQIPSDLKKAYSAYIREYNTHTKPADRRRFYTDRDLPPCERMEDSHYHEHVREIRHRMELMYRSSLANEDKTNILMHNNPMPDFNDINGEGGIDRYNPSWVDYIQEKNPTNCEDESSYKKWLPFLDPLKGPGEVQDQNSTKSSSDHLHRPTSKTRPHRSHRGSKLTFLTDEKVTSDGNFWKDRRNPEIAALPIPGTVIITVAADNADVISEQGCGSGDSNLLAGKSRAQSADSMGGRCSGFSASNTEWQSLSMSALGDHKPVLPAHGHGDYRFGRPTTWKPLLAGRPL